MGFYLSGGLETPQGRSAGVCAGEYDLGIIRGYASRYGLAFSSIWKYGNGVSYGKIGPHDSVISTPCGMA